MSILEIRTKFYKIGRKEKVLEIPETETFTSFAVDGKEYTAPVSVEELSEVMECRVYGDYGYDNNGQVMVLMYYNEVPVMMSRVAYNGGDYGECICEEFKTG